MTDVLAEFNEQLQQRKAAARAIEQKAAEASTLRSENESLQMDVVRFERRVQALRAIGPARLERKQEEYQSNFGNIEYQPLKSKLTGDQLADVAQARLDELRTAIAENERKIAELLAE